MKLRKHREDVKDLKLMADAHVQDIAKRYLNLIRMAEDTYFSGKPEENNWDRRSIKRVLKDAGE